MGKKAHKKQTKIWTFEDFDGFVNDDDTFEVSSYDDAGSLHGFESGSDVSMSGFTMEHIPEGFLEEDFDENSADASTDFAGMTDEELEQKMSERMQKKVGSDTNDLTDESKDEKGVKRLTEVKMSKMYCEIFDFIKIDGVPHVYDEKHGIWRSLAAENGLILLRRFAPESIRHAITRRTLKEIFDWLAAEDDIESIDSSQIDNSCAINCRNGAFFVNSGSPVFNRKEMYFRHYVNTDYLGDQCEGSLFLDFIDSTFSGDKYAIRLFQEVFGYILSEKRDLKTSFLLYGPANTGKSVIGNLLTMMTGKEFTAALSMSDLNNRFGAVKLDGKFLNVGSELNTASRISGDVFKRLLGNDTILVEEKGLPAFSMRNTAAMVFLGNSFPTFNAGEDAKSIDERIIFLPFLHTVPREEWISGLEEKLFEESSFILSWAMKGMARLNSQGYVFSRCRASELLRAQYLSKSFPEYYFVTTYLQADPYGKVSTKEMDLKYKNFCLATEMPVRDRVAWFDVLSKEFVVQSIRGIDFGEKKNLRGFSGVSFKKGGASA